ncbi:MAG: hypothetical protein NTW03_03015 [Verrucomicrobia bacterium]|nr:hypothetical protein [Verrucomicrobiota bacterium]
MIFTNDRPTNTQDITMFDSFSEKNYHRDHMEETREERVCGSVQRSADAERKFEKLHHEFDRLVAITVAVIGKAPSEQRDIVGSHYLNLAEQDEMPTVRDVVRQILAIPNK